MRLLQQCSTFRLLDQSRPVRSRTTRMIRTTDDADAAVTVAVAVTAEAATEATQQKDDEEDDDYE
jgi:hypothetical protein